MSCGTGGAVSPSALANGGCTLSPGYWKTHSAFGPAPYDEAWASLQTSPFSGSGQTYYEVLWTQPDGNPYYILAHAYIAAHLNVSNGANPTAVMGDFKSASYFFNPMSGDPPSPSVQLTEQQREMYLGWAQNLDLFNNGYVGPGACPDDEPEE